MAWLARAGTTGLLVGWCQHLAAVLLTVVWPAASYTLDFVSSTSTRVAGASYTSLLGACMLRHQTKDCRPHVLVTQSLWVQIQPARHLVGERLPRKMLQGVCYWLHEVNISYKAPRSSSDATREVLHPSL